MFHRYLAALVLLLLATESWANHTMQLPSRPALSPDGERMAFAWNGDLWQLRLGQRFPRRLTSHDARESYPVYSPDGKRLAFISNRTGSDQVYVMPAGGGEPKQVTHHTEGYAVHDWFPDGKSLLCTGSRDHHWRDQTRLIRVWIDGSRGDEVLADMAADEPSLSPDGKRILFNREGMRWWRKGYRGTRSAQVWMLDLESNKVVELLHDDIESYWPTWAPDGKSFYYAAGPSEGFDLWRADIAPAILEGGEADEPVTKHQVLDVDTHSVVLPTVARNAPLVVYRHGFDLYQWNAEEAGAAEQIKLETRDDLTIPDDLVRRRLDRASDIAFSNDGLEIAFVAGGDVWVMDTEFREPVQVTDTPGFESDVVWGPDGKSLWFTSTDGPRVDIYTATRDDEEKYWWRNTEFTTKQVTDDDEVESHLRLDPTGKNLLYGRGLGDLWIRELESGDTRRLIEGFDSPDFDISPDGRWLAYSQQDSDFNSEVYLLPIDGSEPPYNISRHPDNDTHPRFSPNGKVLAFTGLRLGEESDIYYVYLENRLDEQTARERKLEEALKKMEKERKKEAKKDKPEEKKTDDEKKEADDGKEDEKDEENKENEKDKEDEDDKKKDDEEIEPIVVDLEGIEDRLHRVSLPGVDEHGLVWLGGDKQRLAFTAEIDGRRGYYTIELPEKLSPKFFSDTTGGAAVWSPGAKAIFLNSGGAPTKIDGSGKATRYSFSAVQQYSRSARFANGFDTAWRIMRDRWYDPRTGGKNWDQIRRRYREAATSATDAQTFGTVIQLMLGELNGSHLGFYPSESDRYDAPDFPDRTAHLGLRFEADTKGPGLVVRDVLPDGPADREDVDIAAGDTVLEIDGVAVDPAMDLTKALNGRPDRDVELKFKKPDADETLTATVRPTSYSRARSLLYRKWLEDSRDRVDHLSGNTLGYLHIRSMDMPSFNEFERQLYAAGHGKEGLVIDVRDNGGGWTTDLLLTSLTQPRHAITVPRGGQAGYPHDRQVFASWHKPIIVLCNQNSFSNAEIFSHAIKSLDRGKLVGVPTAGGVISTGSVGVTDVGRMRMPFRGWFVVGTGEDMELNGAVPQTILWPQPGELPTGVDRQLTEAVTQLLVEVSQQPEDPKPHYRTEED